MRAVLTRLLFACLLFACCARPTLAAFDQDLVTVKQMINKRNQGMAALEQGPGVPIQASGQPIQASGRPIRQPPPPPPLSPGAATVNPARDPFATTPLMMGGGYRNGQSTGGSNALNRLRLRGIISGKHDTALIDTGTGIISLKVGDDFDVFEGGERASYVIRAIDDNSVDVGTTTQTLVILR